MDWLTNDKFANAREKGLSWTEIARHFADGLEKAAQRGEAARTRYQKDAARHTGYSIGMLRNMAATYDWVLKTQQRSPIPNDLVEKSLTALDLIRRLDVHNAGLAEKYLGRLGTTTGVRVSALRAELKAIARKWEEARRGTKEEASKPAEVEEMQPFEPAAQVVATTYVKHSLAQVRSWRTMETMNDIAKLLPVVSGAVHHFGRPDGVSPIGIRATAIAWLDADMTAGDAFEVVNAGHGLSRSTLSDHVSRVIASSRFFRRHYVTFTSDSEPELVYKTKESLEALKVPAVGVIWFGYKGEEAILLKPAGTPTPDWRERLHEICKLGHWQ